MVHNASLPEAKRVLPGFDAVLRLGIGALPVIAFFAAPAVVPVLSVLALFCLIEAIWARRFVMPLAMMIVLPALLWAGLSIFWSVAPGLSTRTSGQLAGTLLTAAALLGAIPGWSRERRAGMLRAAALGLVAAALVMIVDIALENRLTALVKGWDVLDGEQAGWARRNGNRGTALMAVLVWPVAASCIRLGRARTGIAVLGIVLIAILLSGMTNAKLAFLGGLALLGLAFWRPRATAALLAAAIVGWTLLAPVWIAALPDPYHGQSVVNRDSSLLHRVIIWKFVAERISERPLFGWGLETARELPGGRTIVEAPYHAPAATYQTDFMLLPLHPHNAFLQWWVELGAVGMLLLLAIPLSLLRRAVRYPASPRAFALAGLGSIFCISAASFGAWQIWWLSSLILCATLFTSLCVDEN